MIETWLNRFPLQRDHWPHYVQLMRLDKPIGIYLLLWPTLWGLFAAARGLPDPGNLIIFTLGVVLMRSAGCVINDYADRHIDGHVKRTRDRPLAAGKVTEAEALTLFVLLVLGAFILVLFTNTLTILLSFGGLALAATYPYMKRHTYLPQVVLGAAFSWSIPMAWAAQTGDISPVAWLLYTANLLWTVAYDTEYAMVDRDDDLRIGVKSTAILFGEADRTMIAILQGLSLCALWLAGQRLELGLPWVLGLLGATLLFIYQHHLIRYRERDNCFRAFLNNHWVGLVIFIGLVADLTR